MKHVLWFTCFVVLLSLASCDRSPITPAGEVPVQLAVSFSGNSSIPNLAKGFVFMDSDSLRIDSAIVVFSRIKFESHIDSVEVDSSGEKEFEDKDDINVKFKGPFVVHVRDTVAFDFGQRTLPAGTYDGIKFKIHRLKFGEPHEDFDDNHHEIRINPDSLLVGSSIIVWGSVLKNGAWTGFEFRLNEEVEFKVKGNFSVPEATNTFHIALNFHMDQWFRNPWTGALLDPTDTSDLNRSLIRRAILNAFGKGKCGRDEDHDGHPD